MMKLELGSHLFKRTLAKLRMDNAFWMEIAAPEFVSHVEFERSDLSWAGGLEEHWT
jgi:hypothetical protein